MFPNELIEKAEALVAGLKTQNKTITMAESCTGGLLGGLITSISGSSDVFNQGLVTYSNEAKHRLLGVDEELLNTHGAVSEEVAHAMAQGALKNANADVALSITGIAGPSGGSAEKPVGLVYIGVATNLKAQVIKNNFTGDRDAVRMQSLQKAIELALETLG